MLIKSKQLYKKHKYYTRKQVASYTNTNKNKKTNSDISIDDIVKYQKHLTKSDIVNAYTIFQENKNKMEQEQKEDQKKEEEEEKEEEEKIKYHSESDVSLKLESISSISSDSLDSI